MLPEHSDREKPILFHLEQQSNAGQSRIILEDSTSHTVALQSVGFLSMRDHLAAETSVCPLQHSQRRTSMLLVGLKIAISASEWPQTVALDRSATQIGRDVLSLKKN
jgi:hypothetical protein